MVGSAKRKNRLPRKILRTILDDGSCQLQIDAINTPKDEIPELLHSPADGYEQKSKSKLYDDYRQDPIKYENDFEPREKYYRNNEGDMYSRKYEIDLNARSYDRDTFPPSRAFDDSPRPRSYERENGAYEGDKRRYENNYERNNRNYEPNYAYNQYENIDSSIRKYDQSPYSIPLRDEDQSPYPRPLPEGDQTTYIRPLSDADQRPYSRPVPDGDQPPYPIPLADGDQTPYQRPYLEGDQGPYSRPMYDGNSRHYDGDKPSMLANSPNTVPEKDFNGRGDATPSPLSYANENKTSSRYYEHSGKKQYHKTGKLVGNKHQHPEPNAEFPYQCETCDMLFKTIDNLSEHQKSVHDNNRLFTCRFCGKKFNDKYNMRKHVLIHVGERRHKCQFCDKAFLRKDHLRSHLQTHYNRKYGCKSCGKGFRSIEMFERHAKTHKVEPKMEIFNENAPAAIQVDNRHMVNGKQDFRKAVSESLKQFNESKAMNGDQNYDHNTSNSHHSNSTNNDGGNISKQNDVNMKEEEVPVTILDDQLEDSFDWGNVSPTYKSESSFLESPSSMALDDSQSKVRKYANQHMSGYKCKACNQTFDDKTKFDDHEVECSQEKWQCRKCNVTFDEVSTLKQHYDKVHSVENRQPRVSCWRCKSCEITFPNSKELSRHYSQFHKDAQIYPCSECPKTFTVWHNLKKHMLIHLGDKKHKCHICDKGFVRKDHLNSHLKVHMGDGTKYNCPICSKVFRIKDMYFKHMNLHGLEKAYTVK